MVETLVSGALLSIGVVGTVVTVVYQRNLESSTARLWAATADATAELETVRAASESNWSELKTNFDGRTIETEMRYHSPTNTTDRFFASDEYSIDRTTAELTLADGRTYAKDAYTLDDHGYPVVDGVRVQKQADAGTAVNGNMLQLNVIDDASKLDDGGLMWATGASSPNFYAIEVTPASADGEFGDRLRFQTYMADHTSLSKKGATGLVDESTSSDETTGDTTTTDPQDTGGGDTSGGDTGGDGTTADENPFEFTEYSDAVDDTAQSIAISGSFSEMVRFIVTNRSTHGLPVKEVKVEIKKAGEFQEVTIADLAIYNGESTAKFEDKAAEFELPSGDFEIQITADPESNGNDNPYDGGEVKVRFRFTDDSSVEVKFKP